MRIIGETARAEARIKQLCCLGLSSETIMPALMREMHGAISAEGMNCFWVGPGDEVANFYDEQPDAVQQIAPLYFAEFYGRPRERDITRSMAESAHEEYGVISHAQTLRVSQREFARSDFYNLILRPLGYGTVLRLVLRESGQPKAILQLHRPLKGPDFSPEDRQRFSMLEPFLLHALAGKAQEGRERIPFVDSDERGMIIASRDGRPLSFSRNARRLLILAVNDRIQPTCPIRLRELPPPVAALCQHLAEVHAGLASASVPVSRHRNVWGRFVFRAYWLDAAAPGGGLIGITITRQEPLPLRLLSGMRGLPLSPRQGEVAILLAAGHTHAEIAQRLGIARYTAVAHSRWIYNKLDVHDSIGLRKKLLSGESAAGC